MVQQCTADVGNALVVTLIASRPGLCYGQNVKIGQDYKIMQTLRKISC